MAGLGGLHRVHGERANGIRHAVMLRALDHGRPCRATNAAIPRLAAAAANGNLANAEEFPHASAPGLGDAAPLGRRTDSTGGAQVNASAAELRREFLRVSTWRPCADHNQSTEWLYAGDSASA